MGFRQNTLPNAEEWTIERQKLLARIGDMPVSYHELYNSYCDAAGTRIEPEILDRLLGELLETGEIRDLEKRPVPYYATPRTWPRYARNHDFWPEETHDR